MEHHKHDTSRQIFLQRGTIHVKHVHPPVAQANHILVRVHYSFISSGTENATIAASAQSLFEKYTTYLINNTSKIITTLQEHGIAGTYALAQAQRSRFLPLGYSCAGQVIAVGQQVQHFKIGDYVACAGTGYAYHADVVNIPCNLAVKINKPDSLKNASITAIGAIALQALRRADVQLGTTVGIIGLGLVGQLAAQLAKQAGCTVIGIDIRDDRLELAKQCGTEIVFNAQKTDILQEVAHATEHKGVDVTLITAASSQSSVIQQAMQITRRKGRVVVVGNIQLNCQREPFYSKELDLLMSCSYGPGRYDVAYEEHGVDYPFSYVRWTENRNMACFVNLIEKNALTIEPLITQTVSASQAPQAYKLFKQGSLGIVLDFDAHPHDYSDIGKHEIPEIKPYKRPTGKFNIALIGVGGFAKTKILPLLKTIPNISFHSFIDTDTSAALTIAQVYGAPCAGNDYRKIVADNRVNTVVIASPHAYHAEQALNCLQAGMAVLVEKPAVVSYEQLRTLKNFFAAHPEYCYCVDFNRSCAPFMKAIKKHLITRNNPLVISYRMNVGVLSNDHWSQSPEHGGRIIGEACHIFDLFCFLTDSTPLSVVVNTLTPQTDSIPVTDNVAATITMRDGSCCTLLYTSLGHKDVGKEYMEIFFDSKTIIMNDFHELKGFGLPKNFNTTVATADKGHRALYEQFFASVQSSHIPMPIPLERIFIATEVSLIVDSLARRGGGMEYLNVP